MLAKLLVPLDRSPLAAQAVGPAVSIARAARAALDLVVVHEPFPFGGFRDIPWNGDDGSDDLKYIEAVAAEVRSGASVPVTSAVLHGAPAEMICARARDVGADLIVMTSHGRTGLSRAWLGSVADAVVRHSAIPVLLLRPIEKPADLVGATPAFKRMLVLLDGSALAADIIPTATQLAQASGATIVLLRIVPFVPLLANLQPEMPLATLPLVPDDDATQRLEETVRSELEGVAERLRETSHLTVETHVVVNVNTAEAIIDFARGHHIDVIAMSTHGRGASRVLLGSIADKMLRASGLPVLVRRPEGVGAE